MKASLPAPWSLPSGLKRAQLQRIATLVGAPLSGTKAQLLDAISETTIASQKKYPPRVDLLKVSKKKNELRVMSIDMGIRNLAFAFLTSRTAQASATTINFDRPTLLQWRRIDLMGINSLSLQEEMNGSEAVIVESSRGKLDAVMTTESFEPNVMAENAYIFAKYCASFKPTHILIERQRFRSNGHTAVQEWSLRVGMLEAMLHATFRTLVSEQVLSHTVIEPMSPMRVNKYWFRDQDIPAVGKQAKLAKIAIVSNMLQALERKDATFTADCGISEIVDSFGRRGTRAPATNKAAKLLYKYDDMSDALLQGLAWLNWQQNRFKLINEGPEALGICD